MNFIEPFQQPIKKGLTIFILLVTFAAVAQKNLVPNGSFEARKNKRNNTISNAAPWKGLATVDYYQEPFKLDTSKYRGAHTGDAYAGLRFQLQYKEFLFVKLLEPLKANTVYNFTAYFRLLCVGTTSLKHFGAFFSKKPFVLSDKVDETNSIIMYDKKGLKNDYKWIELKGEYTAKGGERYITLGNFGRKTKSDMQKVNKSKIILMFHDAYYFIDDVSLFEKIDSSKIAIPKPITVTKKDSLLVVKNEWKSGDIIPIKNIFFETGKANLLEESNTMLDEIAELLEKKPSLEIRINGHTDNTGKEEFNQKLSEERAKAVFDYLIEKGIGNEIDYKGFGSSKPIASNDSEEGRKQNRRVEIEIINSK